MRYHYIYKITFLKGERTAGHYYIGKRTTKNNQAPYNDGYYGSGKIVKDYYKMYPPKEGETIIKEIIEFNASQEENNKREEYWIGDKYETDPLCLNMRAGGTGGHCSTEVANKIRMTKTGKKTGPCSEKRRKAISEARTGKPHPHKSHNLSEEQKHFLSVLKTGTKNPRTDEQKKSIRSKTGKKIVQLTKNGEFIREYSAMGEAEEITGIRADRIGAVCNKIPSRHTAGKFKWMYADEYYEAINNAS